MTTYGAICSVWRNRRSQNARLANRDSDITRRRRMLECDEVREHKIAPIFPPMCEQSNRPEEPAQREIRRAVLSQAAPGIEPIVERMTFEAVKRCWCGGRLDPWENFGVYRRCSSCGCKAVEFRPTWASLEIFYREYYWREYQAAYHCPPIEERYERDMTDRIPQYLDWMRQLCPPPARLLEIGCGNGRLLREASLAGYDASASEMDPRVAAWVREKTGLPVFVGTLPPLSEGTFQLIVAIDVLEHVPDPRAFVREIRARLDPRGRVLLHCPVIDSDEAARTSRDVFNPLSHLWVHTTESLMRLWREAGFRLRWMGRLFEMPCWGAEP